MDFEQNEIEVVGRERDHLGEMMEKKRKFENFTTAKRKVEFKREEEKKEVKSPSKAAKSPSLKSPTKK